MCGTTATTGDSTTPLPAQEARGVGAVMTAHWSGEGKQLRSKPPLALDPCNCTRQQVEVGGRSDQSFVAVRENDPLQRARHNPSRYWSKSGDLVVVDGLTAHTVFRGECGNRFAL